MLYDTCTREHAPSPDVGGTMDSRNEQSACGVTATSTFDALWWTLSFTWIGISFLLDLGMGKGALGVGVVALVVHLARRSARLQIRRFQTFVGLLGLLIGLLSVLFS